MTTIRLFFAGSQSGTDDLELRRGRRLLLVDVGRLLAHAPQDSEHADERRGDHPSREGEERRPDADRGADRAARDRADRTRAVDEEALPRRDAPGEAVRRDGLAERPLV